MLEGDDLNQKEGYEIYEPVYEDTTDESDESDWKTDRSETLLHNFQDLPDEIILKVLEISDGGFMLNYHAKSLTKPKIKLQPYLVLKQDIFFRKGILYLKISRFKIFPIKH